MTQLYNFNVQNLDTDTLILNKANPKFVSFKAYPNKYIILKENYIDGEKGFILYSSKNDVSDLKDIETSKIKHIITVDKAEKIIKIKDPQNGENVTRFKISVNPEKRNKYEIIKQINTRVYEIEYKNTEAILKEGLFPAEIVPFYEKTYTDKFNFLPEIYDIFDNDKGRCIIMEKLYPFNYEKSKKYIPDLFKEVEQFEKETLRTKLDISASNILTRKNGEIVLFDLWAQGISKDWVSDTIDGNYKTLYICLLYYKYNNQIKEYIEESFEYLEKEGFEEQDYKNYGIEPLLIDYYNETDVPPDFGYVRSLYVGIKLYKTMKKFLANESEDIKTYIPPLSGNGPYWDLYDETKNQYRGKSSLEMFELIFPDTNLNDVKIPETEKKIEKSPLKKTKLTIIKKKEESPSSKIKLSIKKTKSPIVEEEENITTKVEKKSPTLTSPKKEEDTDPNNDVTTYSLDIDSNDIDWDEKWRFTVLHKENMNGRDTIWYMGFDPDLKWRKLVFR